MKQIIIVRHAKTEQPYGDMKDIERKLLLQGKEDAKLIAQKLLEIKLIPDIIITSPAKRAWSTAKRYAKILKYPKEKIISEEFIYENFTTERFLKLVKGLDNKLTVFMTFGHNPYFGNLVSELTNAFNNHLPTCGTVGINFDVNNWNEIALGKGKIMFFEYPKKYS